MGRNGAEWGAGVVVSAVMARLALLGWRSPHGDVDCVAHFILRAVISKVLTECEALPLLLACVQAVPDIMAAENAFRTTPLDLLGLCKNCHLLERQFSIIVFDKFQILKPGAPLYSPLRLPCTSAGPSGAPGRQKGLKNRKTGS